MKMLGFPGFLRPSQETKPNFLRSMFQLDLLGSPLSNVWEYPCFLNYQPLVLVRGKPKCRFVEDQSFKHVSRRGWPNPKPTLIPAKTNRLSTNLINPPYTHLKHPRPPYTNSLTRSTPHTPIEFLWNKRSSPLHSSCPSSI